MAFQIAQLSFDFNNGNGVVQLNQPPTPPARINTQVTVIFPLRPKPTGGTPDAATEAELRAEAKQVLLAAAGSL